MDALATPEGEAVRASIKVAPDTLLRVAYDDLRSADVDTGRGVTTAHQTVADRLGMCSKTVQRARLILMLLGFAAVVIEGRYLFGAERVAAFRAHGSRQLRIASTRALIMPRAARPAPPCTAPAPTVLAVLEDAGSSAPVENVHLPRSGDLTPATTLLKNSPTRARARSGAASRQPRRRGSPDRRSGGRVAVPRSIEVQRFAAQLVNEVPSLQRRRHIGHVVGMLERTGIDVSVWTSAELLAAINSWLLRTGTKWPDVRDAVRFYGWVIRRVVTEESDRLQERRAADERRAQDRARQAAERAADAARLASIDHAEVARIIAQMNADQRERERVKHEQDAARRRAVEEAREELAERTSELRSRG